MDASSGISRWDDLPFHQTVDFFGVAQTSDSHFNDGYYFAALSHGYHIFAGLRLHPNNNVMDGYAGVVSRGEQRNQRVSRALLPHRDELVVGPLRLEIIEPMRRQRVVLDSSDVGLRFDLIFKGVGRPFVETRHRQVRFGRVINDVLRYTQPCRAAGTVEIDGETILVTDWYGARDHSWGLRSTMGPYVPLGGLLSEQKSDERALRLWVPFAMQDHSGFFHLHEDEQGRVLDCEGRIDFDDGSANEILAVRHRLRYVAGTRRLEGGTFSIAVDSGAVLEYEFEVVCAPAHPQGFGYVRGWQDGGQPGVYRGEFASESDRFRVDDPTQALGPSHVRSDKRTGGTEYACALVAGSSKGMAHVEHMIYGTYRPYGFLETGGN